MITLYAGRRKQMKTIVQNLAIEYRDEGVGPVMLFLHGWQDDLRTFDALAALLSSAYRIVRLDMPGFGGSEISRASWSVDDYAGFVADFIAKLRISPDILVGHSFGGRVVIKGIAGGKLSARKIVLIAAPGVIPKRKIYRMLFATAAKFVKIAARIPPLHLWREQLRKKAYRAIGSDYADAGKLAETFTKVIREDLSESARRIKTPALVIWGSHDAITPLAEGRRLADLVSGAVLKVVGGAGHFVHRKHPQEVAELIRKFL